MLHELYTILPIDKQKKNRSFVTTLTKAFHLKKKSFPPLSIVVFK